MKALQTVSTDFSVISENLISELNQNEQAMLYLTIQFRVFVFENTQFMLYLACQVVLGYVLPTLFK